MKAVSMVALLALAACGSTQKLKPAANASLPAVPYGVATPPTPEQLLTPSVQARPQRSDELLKKSEPRQPDPFDLPPR